MKKTMVAFTIILILLFCGCSKKINEGEVYKKEFIPNHVVLIPMPITTYIGDTATSTIRLESYYYSDEWIVYVKNYNEENDEIVEEKFTVSEEEYNSTAIGSWFVSTEHP